MITTQLNWTKNRQFSISHEVLNIKAPGQIKSNLRTGVTAVTQAILWLETQQRRDPQYFGTFRLIYFHYLGLGSCHFE